MFGYILTSADTLPKERHARFRAIYCGLCSSLRQRYGLVGSAALSFDMTFMAMLLNALYEPEEREGDERCAPHPIKAHRYVESDAVTYAADMNVVLAYHKCLDNWRDDKNLLSATEARLLRSAYAAVKGRYPEKCGTVEDWLDEIHAIEAEGLTDIDAPVNATGRALGELFVWRENDVWADTLREVGDGLGRFIYLMDAYDDLPEDARKGRYNPLKPLRDREDYEALCESTMMMMVADATDAFEQLPIVRDADILRNVLYSGIWSKYAYLQKKRSAQGKGAR